MRFSQTGISSMMVLILTVLVLLICWELGQYVELNFPGTDNVADSEANKDCYGGSNTQYDCYDQDEATDYVDTDSERDLLIFKWTDDDKP